MNPSFISYVLKQDLCYFISHYPEIHHLYSSVESLDEVILKKSQDFSDDFFWRTRSLNLYSNVKNLSTLIHQFLEKEEQHHLAQALGGRFASLEVLTSLMLIASPIQLHVRWIALLEQHSIYFFNQESFKKSIKHLQEFFECLPSFSWHGELKPQTENHFGLVAMMIYHDAILKPLKDKDAFYVRPDMKIPWKDWNRNIGLLQSEHEKTLLESNFQTSVAEDSKMNPQSLRL